MTEETNLNQIEEISKEPVVDHIEVSPKTIGQLLKERRLEKGLNLKTISQQTKVLMGLLEHLENDELDKLPSKTYVRGFVKSAAKILGIKQDVALAALEYTYNKDHKVEIIKESSEEINQEAARNVLSSMTSTQIENIKNATTSTFLLLLKSGIAILVVGVIAFNLKSILQRSGDEKVKLPQVLTTLHLRSKPAPKPATVKIDSKIAENQIEKTAEPMKVNLIQDKKDTNQKTDMVVNDVNLKSVSLGEKQFTEDTSIPAEKIDEIFPSRYRVQVTKGIETVFIAATEGDSWITYKVDEKDIKKYVLRQGRTVFIRGEKIRLFIGNVKSLKIFYNNKPISFNAKSGVRNVVFPEELKTKFLNPLFVFQKDGTVVTSEDYIKTNKQQTPPGTTPSNPVQSDKAVEKKVSPVSL